MYQEHPDGIVFYPTDRAHGGTLINDGHGLWPAYQDWLGQGNTPEPADPPPPPPRQRADIPNSAGGLIETSAALNALLDELRAQGILP